MLWKKKHKWGGDNGSGVVWHRYQHRLFYDVLVYRRPDKLIDLGNGIMYINIPVVA